MSSGAHDSGGGLSRSASANALRGIAVIAAAVLVGVLLLARGVPDEETVAAGPDDGATTSEDTTDTTDTTEALVTEEEPTESTDGTEVTPDTTGTTTPDITTTAPAAEARPPSEVRVLVLNGSGRQGEAGRGAAYFAEQGYETADPKNAESGGPSAIFFAEGYEAEAEAAAGALNLDPALVLRPLDPAAPPIADTQGANLIVLAGTDGLIRF